MANVLSPSNSGTSMMSKTKRESVKTIDFNLKSILDDLISRTQEFY